MLLDLVAGMLPRSLSTIPPVLRDSSVKAGIRGVGAERTVMVHDAVRAFRPPGELVLEPAGDRDLFLRDRRHLAPAGDRQERVDPSIINSSRRSAARRRSSAVTARHGGNRTTSTSTTGGPAAGS